VKKQDKEAATDTPHLHHRATPRLHTSGFQMFGISKARVHLAAQSEATFQLVEDGDFFQGVRIMRLESLLWFDTDELEGDVDIVFFAVPGVFLFSDFHKVGKDGTFVNATQLPECDTLRSEVVFHILAGHSSFEDVSV
jgi:hypothetical protein